MSSSESHLVARPKLAGAESPEQGENSIGLIDYADQRTLKGSQNLLDKFRVQMPIILVACALAQYLASWLVTGHRDAPDFTRNSILFSFVANVASLLNYRSLRLFPGSRRFSYLLPAFALPYGFLLAFLLWARPAYSVPLLAVGFSLAIMMAWLLNALNRRPASAPMMLVPSPAIDRMLAELPGLHCISCQKPAEITNQRRTIVADLHADLDEEWQRAIAQAALRGSTVYHVKQVRESLTGRVEIDHISENSSGMLQPNSLYFAAKDLVERCMALIALVLTLPLIALAAIAIRLESAGPAFFLQQRIGYQGKAFTIFKLRTMVTRPADQRGRDHSITLADDPRITPLGRLLRRTRIDELPQLLNVIRGDMALIGPRPEAIALSNWYDQVLDFYSYRHIVRPGITGWAQVKQGHVADPQSVMWKTQYDFFYIKHFSLWLDLLIVLKTLHVIVSGHGSK